MKIGKAIEVLQEDITITGSVEELELHEAESLGIEALKWMRDERVIHGYNRIPHIVGETKE